MREYHLKRYHRMRNQAIEELGGKCVQCGSVKDLELDHIDLNSKKFEVSQFLSVSLKDFKEELQKCQVLCKKCHQEKSILESGRKIAKGSHGTVSTYRYCKCNLCKEAVKRAREKYFKTHKRITVNGKRITVPL